MSRLSKRINRPDRPDRPEIEVGQVWEFDPNKENPFKDSSPVRFRVLDVNGRFVKYVEDGKDEVYARSDSISWFKIGSRRIA